MRLLIVFAITLITVSVFAQEPKKGFSGYFDIGGFYVNNNDALSTNDKNEDIDTLDDNPDSFSSVKAVALFGLNYDVPEKNLRFHFGVSPRYPKPEPSVGLTKIFDDKSVFGISFLIKPFETVWENPYVSDRDDTKDSAMGLSISYKNIMGQGYGAQLKLISHDIDDDKIGNLYDEMKRDGTEAVLQIGRELKANSFLYHPYLTFGIDSRDGEAESSKSYGAGALLSKIVNKKDMLMANISFEDKKFDKTSPVFDKTRRELTAGAFFMYVLNNPFDMKKKHIKILGGMNKKVSNIDFYDAETYFIGTTFGIKF
jgi:hypothetical protein